MPPPQFSRGNRPTSSQPCQSAPPEPSQPVRPATIGSLPVYVPADSWVSLTGGILDVRRSREAAVGVVERDTALQVLRRSAIEGHAVIVADLRQRPGVIPDADYEHVACFGYSFAHSVGCEPIVAERHGVDRWFLTWLILHGKLDPRFNFATYEITPDARITLASIRHHRPEPGAPRLQRIEKETDA